MMTGFLVQRKEEAAYNFNTPVLAIGCRCCTRQTTSHEVAGANGPAQNQPEATTTQRTTEEALTQAFFTPPPGLHHTTKP
jgi:hypothetical protein